MQPELYRQMRDLEDRHWWFRGRRCIVADVLGRLNLQQPARILDLGCGTGGNLEMLSGFGEVTGVEHDAQAVALAAARDVAPVLRGSLPHGLPEGLASIDCVAMLDVLEHIEGDRESLGAVHALLSPGGYLVLTVPAWAFLWGPHDREHHHKRRYRAPTLRKLLEGTGFRVVKLSYYNAWLFPPVALVRLVRMLIPGGEAGADEALPPGWLNGMLERLFASERHVLRYARFPFGVSLLAVARTK
jgi:SAM-dependent methyltransferase